MIKLSTQHEQVISYKLSDGFLRRRFGAFIRDLLDRSTSSTFQTKKLYAFDYHVSHQYRIVKFPINWSSTEGSEDSGNVTELKFIRSARSRTLTAI